MMFLINKGEKNTLTLAEDNKGLQTANQSN